MELKNLKIGAPIETIGPVMDKTTEPPWLKIARGEIGIHEIQGPQANPKIVQYASTTTLKATSDEVPWCAAFVCWCLEQCKIKSTRSAAAGSFLEYGAKLDYPRLGCIVVFQRVGGHHVGFYLGASSGHPDFLDCLSGNSGDCVRISRYPKSHVLSYRWPS